MRTESRIAWLSSERSREFENVLSTSFENYRYFDFKILPELKPAEVDNGEDAFKWYFDWCCEIGLPQDRVIKKHDLTSEQNERLDEFAQEFGWHLVQATKKTRPMPWKGSFFSLTSYKSHPTWKYVENFNDQGHHYTYGFSSHESRNLVGVIQVKNADLSIATVIENCLDLFDWIVILENNSTDNTIEEIEKISTASDKILVKHILNISSGGRYLNSLCGTDTVVVKVDADEFFDPTCMKELRKAYQEADLTKLVLPSTKVLDVNGVDLSNGVCVGKTRLDSHYYFGNILAWHQTKERCHGRPWSLRTGCTEAKQVILEDSLSQLHFPFLNFSSLKRRDLSPGDERQKARYIEKDSNKWEIAHLENFNIDEILSSILNTNIWTVGDTHSQLFSYTK